MTHGAVVEAPVAHLSLASEAQEQKRWMTWFGLPVVLIALFVALALGTGQEAFIGLAIGALIVDIGVLIWLALSSDTNSMLGNTGSHH
jgi:hypothetical protein